MNSNPLLLFDGMCGFCNRSVQFILKHDKQGVFRYAALQSEYARVILSRHKELADIDSLVIVLPEAQGNERLFIRSAAVIKALSYLGWPCKFFTFMLIIPAPLRDAVYDFIAKNRYRFFDRVDQCFIPSTEIRNRFLDQNHADVR